MLLKQAGGEPECWESYVATMARDGIWGDSLTLLAACVMWNCTIKVINSLGNIITVEAPSSWGIQVTVSLSLLLLTRILTASLTRTLTASLLPGKSGAGNRAPG